MLEISENIYFENENELHQTMKNWLFLGQGACGACYLTPTNEVYKIYNFEVSTIDIESINFDGFLGFQNDTYVFPEKLIFVNNQLFGYTMRYIKGQELTFCFDNLTFKSLPKFIHKLEVDTANISNALIKSADIKIQNAMVNSKGIFIVDTEDYKYNKAFNQNKLYRNNKLRIRQMFIVELVTRFPLIKVISKRDNIMQDILKTLKYDETASLVDFFKRLRIITANTLGEKVYTIGDLDKLDQIEQKIRMKY